MLRSPHAATPKHTDDFAIPKPYGHSVGHAPIWMMASVSGLREMFTCPHFGMTNLPTINVAGNATASLNTIR